jgi:hypothetical protein
MGPIHNRSAPLVERILTGRAMGYDTTALVECPVCQWVSKCNDLVAVLRERGGRMITVARVHPICGDWFDGQVLLARSMLAERDVSKCIVLSHILCRDIIGRLICILWPPSREEVNLRIFAFMQGNPGLFP